MRKALRGRPVRLHREAEAEALRVAHQRRQRVGQLLVEHAPGPAVLAAGQQPVHGALGQRAIVLQQPGAQEVVELGRQELAVQAGRDADELVEHGSGKLKPKR